MKYLILIVALVISVPVQAHADTKHPITTWECGDITLTSDLQPKQKRGTGTVVVMGHTYEAGVLRTGFVIRWYFYDDYQVIMNRDQSAGYYDFTGATENEGRDPVETFSCKIVPVDKQK